MPATERIKARNTTNRLLHELRGVNEFGERLERISARLLDSPYLNNPLDGGPDAGETLVIRFDGFDCVTYVETVLALAGSITADGFSDALCAMRYAGGEVAWRRRNHYMLDWAQQNQRRGLIKNLTSGPRSEVKARRLSLIKGLRARTVTFRVFPKRGAARLRRLAETGDVALFASTRRNLDVFHMGLLIKRGADLWLRHASRTAGRVIEQPLADFLKAHRMSGVILLRPLCRR